MTTLVPKYDLGETGAVNRPFNEKLAESVSVLDFGADPTGVADSTSAFNSALATRKRIYIPNGTYSVADINLAAGGTSGQDIQGESREGVVLEVRTSGAGAFTYTSVYQFNMSNMTVRAASGVISARFIKQTDLSAYSAYVTFTNIETSANLLYSYEGFFIFTTWRYCRDGYIGTAGATHVFIKSTPATSSQLSQTNICQVLECQIFGAAGSFGAVLLEWGDMWAFRNTDFESNNTVAVQASGIFNLSFDGCWFENNNSTANISAGNSTAPNTQGSTVDVSNCWYSGNAANQYFLLLSGAASGTVTNLNAANVPAGCKLTNSVSLSEVYAIRGLSGAGAAGFVTGIGAYRDNLVISSSEMTTNVINSPQANNQNILPIGPSGLGAASFTNLSFTSITDTASGIGLATQAVRFDLAGVAQAAYYAMPAKLVAFLQGKTVTLIATGYSSTTAAGDTVATAAWDSVVPNATNYTSVSTVGIATPSSTLQTTYITFTVGAAATSLAVGIRTGGSAAAAVVDIETMTLVLGEIKPIFTGFN
jgi:hypothetical protein